MLNTIFKKKLCLTEQAFAYERIRSLSFSIASSTSYYVDCQSLIRYDKKDTSKLTLIDLQLLAAMGPPGGGRNPITSRFLRHFNVISINEFNDETMTRIFSAIVNFYLKVGLM